AAAGDDRAMNMFGEACRRADTDPREKQRLRDIGDLLDYEDDVYTRARAALQRGAYGAAVPLLRIAARGGIGEAAWLLGEVLERHGQAEEACTWNQCAAEVGDLRAQARMDAVRRAELALLPPVQRFRIQRRESITAAHAFTRLMEAGSVPPDPAQA